MTTDEIFNITINHGYALQILAAEIIFTVYLKKRKYFPLRAIFGIMVYLALSVVIPNIIAHFTAGFFSFAIFCLSILLCVFCFKGGITRILFCCVGAQLTQNLSYNIESLIVLSVREKYNLTNGLWFCLSVAVMAVVYLVAYFVLVKRMREQSDVKEMKFVFPIAVASAVFVYFMQYLFTMYQIDGVLVARLPLIACCIFALAAQFGFFAYSNKERENAELEKLILKEKRQYDLMRSTIDLINVKAHDLKHYINKVMDSSGENSEELKEIGDAVEIYENNFQSGNKALDVVLTEKRHMCMQNDIALSVIAKGETVSFMHSMDIYSLFGNALDNAIECEKKLEKEKRFISLKLVEKDDIVSLRIANYCLNINMKDGLPVTDKSDKEFHGFGLKSISYIVKKYGGIMKIEFKDNVFALNIIFSRDNAAKQI